MLLRDLASGPREGLVELFQTVRRDVVTVARDLFGERPSPVARREPLARHLLSDPLPSTGDLLAHRSLRVARVVRETEDAVSLHLEDPTGRAIEFAPGQFLTLDVPLPSGRSVKRAYSLSAIQGEGENASRARVTVKRVAGGKVSNHLNEHCREGDVLTVLGPSGSFGVSAEEARGAHLLLVGGGSGITPLRCILEARLSDPSVTVTLLFGNRSQSDVIFADEIAEIERAHAGRLSVRHVLESPPEGWGGGTGRLDKGTAAGEIRTILASERAAGRETIALVCGPAPMMEAVREALIEVGVPRERIREEQFTSPEQRKPVAATASQPLSITVRGRTFDGVAAAGQTLLEAGLAAGAPMPFSCAMGGCGACKVKLRSGRVVADEPNCLSAGEAREGFVLACVSRAAEPVTLEVV
ncbi:MAG: ferredoxin--NADP reductase [Polyangiaceae bacterium]